MPTDILLFFLLSGFVLIVVLATAFLNLPVIVVGYIRARWLGCTFREYVLGQQLASERGIIPNQYYEMVKRHVRCMLCHDTGTVKSLSGTNRRLLHISEGDPCPCGEKKVWLPCTQCGLSGEIVYADWWDWHFVCRWCQKGGLRDAVEALEASVDAIRDDLEAFKRQQLEINAYIRSTLAELLKRRTNGRDV